MNATNLRYSLALGVYYIRELTLVNMVNEIKNYTNIPSYSPNLFLAYLDTKIFSLFQDSHSYMDSIIGSPLKFSENTTQILNNQLFHLQSLNHNYSLINIATSVMVSMVQINSAFYYVSSHSPNITQQSDDVFNFIFNSMNIVGQNMKTQVELFIKEMKIKKKNLTANIIVIYIIFFLFNISIYFVITCSYISIAKRKASYISVFSGIGLGLIKISMAKCEKFINKISRNEENFLFKKKNENNNEGDNEYFERK